MTPIHIRALEENDIPLIVETFAKHNWPKPYTTFETYWIEQKKEERFVWVAFYNQEFAGYVTLSWHSLYQPFKTQNIPEIMDLNVLPPYRKKGIGSALLDIAEQRASTKNTVIGIGVSLYADYGPAQKLYLARGYVPDGLGVTYNYARVHPGSTTILDDDLVFWFTKKLYPSCFKNWSFFKAIDLTHALSANIPTWEGDCGFELKTILDYTACTTDIKFRAQRIEMLAGAGTHIDAPSHSTPGGMTIDKLSLEHLLSPCVVIDVSNRADEHYKVSPEDITAFENEYGTISPHSFVLIRTGWDQFWDTPNTYRNNLKFPSISEKAALLLLQRDISGIGIDTLSPDRPEDGFPVHKAILTAGKYIVENIANSKCLPPIGSFALCLPIKIKDGTEAPVRLIALIKSRKTNRDCN